MSCFDLLRFDGLNLGILSFRCAGATEADGHRLAIKGQRFGFLFGFGLEFAEVLRCDDFSVDQRHQDLLLQVRRVGLLLEDASTRPWFR
jgi:hypothetical protein